MYGLREWLAREADGTLLGGRQQQRGAGDHTLCSDCNSRTGSWYGGELIRAAHTAARLLADADLEAFDGLLEYTVCHVRFVHSENGPHPLRLIKQIVTMMLATCPPELGSQHPELAAFVLDRERVGLPDRFRFYLALYAGTPRSSGIASSLDLATGATVTFAEVARPPLSYIMTIDSPPQSFPTAEITELTTFPYTATADIDIELLVGFGHTPYPGDYRTQAMLDRDRQLR